MAFARNPAVRAGSASSGSAMQPRWAKKFRIYQSELDESVKLQAYDQNQLERVDRPNLLRVVDDASRAGFGFLVDDSLLETSQEKQRSFASSTRRMFATSS
jgi:hypothetical protein